MMSGQRQHGKSAEASEAYEDNMDLNILKDTPPRVWPEGAAKMFLGILRDDQTDESERLFAAELAGDFVVVSDELVDALLSIARSGEDPDNQPDEELDLIMEENLLGKDSLEDILKP